MRRVNIVVEGQTEETFVRDVLVHHLAALNVFVTARMVATSPGFRGGLVAYGKAKRDIERWLKQDKEALVSTMFDLYALPADFPQRDVPRQQGETAHDWALRMEKAFAAELNNPRFIPYLQVHDYEALLFSDVTLLGTQLAATPREQAKLQEIRSSFPTPEDINDSPQTAPSKRLLKLFPAYQKPVDGVLSAQKIGLQVMRRECPHFAEWLASLEQHGNPPPATSSDS